MAVARLKSRNALHPWAFYPDGWGATHLLPTFARQLTSLAAVAAAQASDRGGGGAAAWHHAVHVPPGATYADELADAEEDAATRDAAAAVLAGGEPLPPHLAQLVAAGRISRATAAAAASMQRIPHVQPSLTPMRASGRVTVLNGSFPSPPVVPPLPLPPAAATATFQLVLPRGTSTSPPPLVILLPGTGEQGYTRRRLCVAYPLAVRGVATLILEGPYYGSRKPAGQVGSKLAALMDLCILGRTTIEEGRALAAWARDLRAHHLPPGSSGSGGGGEVPAFGPIVYAGTSMGGLHAAMSASLTPWDTGVVSWLGPPSAAPVFTVGALQRAVAWDALATQATAPTTGPAIARHVAAAERVLRIVTPQAHEAAHVRDADRASDAAAAAAASAAAAVVGAGVGARTAAARHPPPPRATRALVARLLAVTDLTNFAPPRRTDAALFTYAAHDRYIPAGDGTAVAGMWRRVAATWPAASVRAIRGGHVSGSIFALEEYLASILRCIRVLQPGALPTQ